MEDLVLNPGRPGHLLAAGQIQEKIVLVPVVFQSKDGGATWSWHRLSTEAGVASAVACDPSNDRILFAGGLAGEKTVLVRSGDGGETWTDITGGVTGRVLFLRADERTAGRIWAGTDSGLFRSDNAGSTWTRLSSFAARCVLVDPANSRRLFAAGAAGVWTSRDGGTTWQRMNGGLSVRDVNCLGREVRSDTLYAGTEGGGLCKRIHN